MSQNQKLPLDYSGSGRRQPFFAEHTASSEDAADAGNFAGTSYL